MMIKKVIVMASLLGLVAPVPSAFAADLETLRDTFAVKTDKPISSLDIKEGSPFQGTLGESLSYHGELLPQGTQFIGHVTDADTSRRFGRPAHVEVTLEKVVFPNGRDYQFSEKEQDENTIHISNSDKDFKGLVKSRAQVELAEKVVDGAALLLTNFSLEEAAPVAIGAELLAGVYQEFRDKQDTEMTTGKRLAKGVYRATILYQAVNFIKKQPEVKLDAGQPVYIHFRPRTMLKILSQPESI